MRKIIIFFVLAALAVASVAQAGSIQYLSSGRKAPPVKVTFSTNNGGIWEHRVLKPGQICTFPKGTTHLRIDNVPFDPKRNYKVKEGNVF
ncbi:hypothetical protein [Desulfovibrio sp. ZJ200]|uniref:hypothetical protein n=1 Tax=Desulfovibrio sp. ZJ200 TaxID=2709792 RepID=UPI0013EE036F|nr:hypothetical protein [Desulfovibrio sp. ZJ200]